MFQRSGRLVVGEPEPRPWRSLAIAWLLVLIFVCGLGSLLFNPQPIVSMAATVPLSVVREFEKAPVDPTLVYTVRSGDTLDAIGERHAVSWQFLWELNRDVLSFNAENHCRDLSLAFTQREVRRGRFCNELVFDERGVPLVAANTVKAGDVILVPKP